jgi:hypothetical protein
MIGFAHIFMSDIDHMSYLGRRRIAGGRVRGCTRAWGIADADIVAAG